MKEGRQVETCAMHRIKQIQWVLVGKHEEKQNLEELSVGGRIV
jgi:hypothetical protein